MYGFSKPYRLLSVEFRNCLKAYQSCGRASHEQTPVVARMLLDPDINAAKGRAKPEVKHSQLSYYNSSVLINNVEIENIK